MINIDFMPKGSMIMNKKTKVILTFLCLGIAFMDISELPGVLLRIDVADVDRYIIPLLINFILIGIVAVLVIKIFNVTYHFGFTTSGLGEGLKKYALPGIVAGILSFVAFLLVCFLLIINQQYGKY